MKLIFSQHQIDYQTYTFSFGVYCVKETQQEIPEIYAKGFLPFTGDFSIKKDIFYLARSVRINLDKFTDTSENRRVNRLVEPLKIDLVPVQKANFDTTENDFLDFCQQYAETRFDGGQMDNARIKYIFNGNILSHILIFRSVEKTYGYVCAAIHGNTLHYWYSFFDLDYLKSHSLGKWMMWRTIRWAMEQNLDYVYLGTCYKTKALYKIRDHKGVEFFDGVRWNDDMKLIKHLCKRDETVSERKSDLLKSKVETEKSIFQFLFED